MASQVDVTKPIFGSPSTQSVRDNFQILSVEVTDLQNKMAAGPFVPSHGGTMTGPLHLHNDPTEAMMPVTLGYFVANGGVGPGAGAVPEAPSGNGILYGRQDGAWENIADSFLPLNGGGVVTGSIQTSGDVLSNTLQITGNAGAGFTSGQGLSLIWNLTGGSGEADFCNGFAGAGRAFSWWQRNASNTAWDELMHLDPSGHLTTTASIYCGEAGASQYGLSAAGVMRFFGWMPNSYDAFDTATFQRTYVSNGKNVAVFDALGTLSLWGNLFCNDITLNTGGTSKIFFENTQQRSIGWDGGNGLVYWQDGPGTVALFKLSDLGRATAYDSICALKSNTRGGFVSSWQYDTGEIGFWTSGTTLHFGNGDGAGGVGASRLAIDNNGNVYPTGDVSVPTGHNVSAGNAMLADHIFAFRRGAVGGLIGSWEQDTVRVSGFRVNAWDGSMEFGPSDGAGNLQSVSQVLYTNGTLTIMGQGFKPGGGEWSNLGADIRVKKEILGDYKHGLSEILELKPIRYRFEKDLTAQPKEGRLNGIHDFVAETETEFVGLVAQDVETIMPEMVSLMTGEITGGEQIDDLRVLDTSALTYALCNAIKTLDARVRALEGVS